MKKVISIIILSSSLSFCLISFSQTSDDYQEMVDSLENVKASLGNQIIKIENQIKEIKELKNEVWILEQNGQQFVFIRDGEFYDKSYSGYSEVAKAKKGTKVILIEKSSKYFWKINYNGDEYFAKHRWLIANTELEKKIKEKMIADSLAIVNTKPMVFFRDACLYKEPYLFEECKRVSKGTHILLVKTINKVVDSYVIYQDSIFYTRSDNIETLEKYQVRLAGIEKARKASISAKEEMIKKFGTKDTQRILDKKIWIGMTKEMLKLSWGTPDDINRTVTSYKVSEQWVYGTQYVYIDDGIVTAWQD